MTELRDKLEQSLQAGLTDESLAKINNQLSDILNTAQSDLQYRIQSDIAYNLAYEVERIAESIVEAILSGDEEAMKRAIKAMGYTGRDDSALGHSVIRGRLFEPQPVELRRRIVQAHSDLLISERILDLESQVASLTKQVTRLDTENSRIREERYSAA